MRPVIVFMLLVLGLLDHVQGGDDDDDDDDVTDTGFGSRLTDVMDRVKTREVERMLHTSWCVVGGPSCTTATRAGLTQELVDLNRFSLCLCRASPSQNQCSLRIHFPIGGSDHMTVEKDFSVVFYWAGSVKDFYCYISQGSVLACRFSHALLIPTSSRVEVRNFFNKTQKAIEDRSTCDEFCTRFRCIFEGWVNFGHTLSYNQIYDQCVNRACTTTPLPLSKTASTATTAKSQTTSLNSAESARRVHAKPRTIMEPTKKIQLNRSATVKDGDNSPDSAKQDGDDLDSDDSSTLIAGLVGGMLALALLALAAFVILLWRRKRKQGNEQRPEPSIKFSASNGVPKNTESNHTSRRNPIAAVNPLAAIRHERQRRSDVKPLTSRASFDETYATLSECQINEHDNLAFDVSLNKGEELVLGDGNTNPAFVIDGVYAAPTNQDCAKRESSTDDDYLEPVSQAERYVALPTQYMEPVHENQDEYLEPVPVESAYVGPSYMRMESTVSGKSEGRGSAPLTDDIQYEVIHSAQNNYYNM